ARVARPRLVLRLPVVADLLEVVLERGVRRAMRALALAVLLGGAVVRLRELPLRLGGRALERVRQLRLDRLSALRGLRHVDEVPGAAARRNHTCANMCSWQLRRQSSTPTPTRSSPPSSSAT